MAPSQLFTAPGEVFRAFVERAEARHWPFEQGQIDEVFEQFRDMEEMDFHSRLTYALSLKIWLGDPELTVREHIEWVQDVHPGWQHGSQGNITTRFPDRTPRVLWPDGDQPFVRPVFLNLATHIGRSPDSVRQHDSVGAEGLATIALHPTYAQAMGTGAVRGIWLPGLQLDGVHPQDGSSVPRLYYSQEDGCLLFGTGWQGSQDSNYAAPTVQ